MKHLHVRQLQHRQKQMVVMETIKKSRFFDISPNQHNKNYSNENYKKEKTSQKEITRRQKGEI